jgi:hypothetical protein
MENDPLRRFRYDALDSEAKGEIDQILRMAESGLRAALSRIKSYHDGEPVPKILGEFNSTALLLQDAVQKLAVSYQLKGDKSST